jgi:hypothetical protein
MKVVPQALAWAGIVVLGGAIAVSQAAAPAAGQRSDGQIEMDVVHALDASKALKKDLITAATIQGEVTLAGTVASESSKELAESIVSRVSGVTAVHNNLKVGNPQDAQDLQAVPPPEPSDAGQDQMADNPGDTGPAPPPQAYPQQTPGQDQASGPDQTWPQNRTQGPPPPPDGSQPQYAPMRPRGQAYPPPPPAYEAPKGPVTIPVGTLIQVRANEPVDSKRAKEGTPVQFTVIQDVAFGGVLAIPRGATARGVITEVKAPGELTGSPVLALKLTSLELGGQSYDLQTDQFKVKGPGKGESTAGHMIGGAVLGAIIGGAVGRGPGAAIGAGAGAGAGAAASAASPGPGVWIPAEALVDFHLAQPVTVNPVSQQEASRLAQGLYPGGPTLYGRGYYRPGYYARPYGYPYPYPPVYYRPYYISGGYYYWR